MIRLCALRALALACATSVLAPMSEAGAQVRAPGAPPEQNRFTRKLLVEGLDEPI